MGGSEREGLKAGENNGGGEEAAVRNADEERERRGGMRRVAFARMEGERSLCGEYRAGGRVFLNEGGESGGEREVVCDDGRKQGAESCYLTNVEICRVRRREESIGDGADTRGMRESA